MPGESVHLESWEKSAVVESRKDAIPMSSKVQDYFRASCEDEMKQGSLFILLVLAFATSVQGDVVEHFWVGSPFDSGVVGLNPGTEISIDNEFESSPLTGSVEARDARSILAGNDDVVFTAQAGGATQIHFDMGAGIAVSSLPDSMLLDSQILMSGIEADVDATNFSFQFTAQFVDGSAITNINDLDISATIGSAVLTDLDLGLFEVELTGNTGSSSISITTSSGGILRAVQFRSIVPDFETDELTVHGSRSLFASVPEPGLLVFLGFIATVAALRRRKSA